MSAIHLFHYDIPEVTITSPTSGREYKQSVIPNPSAELWECGAVRLTDSCWLIHEGSVPYTLIRSFTMNGVKWGSAPFDPSAAPALTEMAMNSVRKEVQEYLTRAKDTQAIEDARLAELEAPDKATAEKAHKRYRAQLAAVARRVRSTLARVQKAAVAFGIAGAFNMNHALACVAGIKEAMSARANAFAKAHELIVRTRGAGDHVAGAIAANDIYGPVAADYVQDIGTREATAAAEQLRNAFGL